jgi:methionyl aminopeptidase
LYEGIKAIKVGSHIGVIGNAIYKHAKNKGFNVISSHGGHGLCSTDSGEGIPHAYPFVANKANPNEGIRIQEGLIIAIEPLLVPFNCPTTTKIGADKWTTYCEDLCTHSEHSLIVHKDHVEIITQRDDEILLKKELS